MSSVSPPIGPRNHWLHQYAVLVVLATFGLIGLGGLVTSKGVGMAVPDWPNTYGYNMFFFPFRLWQGGIFDEHVHRLAASGVGLLTLILAVWIQMADPRPWLKRLAWATLVLVVVQGILGGTRVILNGVSVLGIPGSIFFGILHAVTAQAFLCFVGSIALVTSRHWEDAKPMPMGMPPSIPRWVTLLTGLILVQLAVAATMRHQHAGLAISDFPLAHGRIYPPSDAGFVASLNQRRSEVLAYAPITAFQIHLHMLHRLLAVVIVAGVWLLSLKLFRLGGSAARWGVLWSALLLGQFMLGVATIWTDKAADLATAHVVCGAASLLTGVLFSLVLQHAKVSAPEDNSCPMPQPFLNPIPVATGTAVASWRPTR